MQNLNHVPGQEITYVRIKFSPIFHNVGNRQNFKKKFSLRMPLSYNEHTLHV